MKTFQKLESLSSFDQTFDRFDLHLNTGAEPRGVERGQMPRPLTFPQTLLIWQPNAYFAPLY